MFDLNETMVELLEYNSPHRWHSLGAYFYGSEGENRQRLIINDGKKSRNYLLRSETFQTKAYILYIATRAIGESPKHK